MDLSQELSTGLKRVANPSIISEEIFNKLLKEVDRYFEEPFNSKNSLDFPKTLPRIDLLKESYASLTIFVLEVIKGYISKEIAHKILSEYNFTRDQIDKIVSLSSKHVVPLQIYLKGYNNDPPHIFNVKYKMSYCVKSSFSDFDGKVLYFINLIVKTSSTHDKNCVSQQITFVCTTHQLQSLVANLKSAVRQIQSISDFTK